MAAVPIASLACSVLATVSSSPSPAHPSSRIEPPLVCLAGVPRPHVGVTQGPRATKGTSQTVNFT
jgi:hypothetical protein